MLKRQKNYLMIYLQIIVTQKQHNSKTEIICIFVNNLAKTKISVHIATYCNKILINCNNINNKIDQILIFYCHSDTIKTLSSIVVENPNIQS